METLTPSVIVFSKNYLPLNRINLKRAITLLVTGKAEPINLVADVIWEIRSPNLIVQVPAYIRLYNASERAWRIPSVSRKEIFRRDRYQCQYCSNKKDLTIDHIIPRSKGGKNTWDNLVTACTACNSRKGDCTPEQVGMKLKTKPKPPMYPLLTFTDNFWNQKGFGLGA
jgi:5-methylcytosine-specific restriction endonuclease McrA